jgi:hypothetical protein
MQGEIKTQTLYETAVRKKENWRAQGLEQEGYCVCIREQRMWDFHIRNGLPS